MDRHGVLSKFTRGLGATAAGLAGLVFTSGCVNMPTGPSAEPVYDGLKNRYFMEATANNADAPRSSNASLLGALFLGAGSLGARTPRAALTMGVGSDVLKTKAQVDGMREAAGNSGAYRARNYEIINEVMVNSDYSIAISPKHRAALFTYTGYFDHNGNKLNEVPEYFNLGKTGFSPDCSFFSFLSETGQGTITLRLFSSEGNLLDTKTENYEKCRFVVEKMNKSGRYVITVTMEDGTVLPIGLEVK